MKRTTCASLAFLFAAMVIAARPTLAQNGSIDFVARATPSGGVEEPVRGFPLFLLSKSFAQINQEVNAASPQPSMDHFIDGLTALSPKLRAWMKKNQCVKLSGPDFLHKLKAEDVMDVPEFYRAYMDGSQGESSMDFPSPKFKVSDEKKNPGKYQKLKAAYHDAIYHYIEQNPQTLSWMEQDLADSDPQTKWTELVARTARENRRRTLDLAQSKYLVARASTNLEGEGQFQGVTPGTYWVSSLDMTATVGDARPRWDVPVRVLPGRSARVDLSNVNAAPPSQGAQ